MGRTVHTTLLPSTPATWPKRFSGTGKGAIRRSMPESSTGSGSVRSLCFRHGRIVRAHPLGQWIEGRRPARLQRDQVRSRGARKAELELHAVIHRIKSPDRQKVQEPAIGIERGTVVTKFRLRNERTGLVRHVM